MPRNEAASVNTAFRSEKPRKVLLVEIETGASTLRYTNRGQSETFNGAVFSHRPLEHDEVKVEGHTGSPTSRLRVANVDGAFDALINAGTRFEDKAVRIWQAPEGNLGGAGAEGRVDHLRIEGVERAHGAISFTLRTQLGILDADVPLRTISRALFPNIPAGSV